MLLALFVLALIFTFIFPPLGVLLFFLWVFVLISKLSVGTGKAVIKTGSAVAKSVTTMKCPHCYSVIDKNSSVCKVCKKDINPNTMVISHSKDIPRNYNSGQANNFDELFVKINQIKQLHDNEIYNDDEFQQNKLKWIDELKRCNFEDESHSYLLKLTEIMDKNDFSEDEIKLIKNIISGQYCRDKLKEKQELQKLKQEKEEEEIRIRREERKEYFLNVLEKLKVIILNTAKKFKKWIRKRENKKHIILFSIFITITAIVIFVIINLNTPGIEDNQVNASKKNNSDYIDKQKDKKQSKETPKINKQKKVTSEKQRNKDINNYLPSNYKWKSQTGEYLTNHASETKFGIGEIDEAYNQFDYGMIAQDAKIASVESRKDLDYERYYISLDLQYPDDMSKIDIIKTNYNKILHFIKKNYKKLDSQDIEVKIYKGDKSEPFMDYKVEYDRDYKLSNEYNTIEELNAIGFILNDIADEDINGNLGDYIYSTLYKDHSLTMSAILYKQLKAKHNDNMKTVNDDSVTKSKENHQLIDYIKQTIQHYDSNIVDKKNSDDIEVTEKDNGKYTVFVPMIIEDSQGDMFDYQASWDQGLLFIDVLNKIEEIDEVRLDWTVPELFDDNIAATYVYTRNDGDLKLDEDQLEHQFDY